MGQILFAPAGAGVTSDDVTATKAQVLSGYTALTSDSDDEAASGSMTNNGAWTSSSSGSGKITVPAGYHNGSGYVDCTGAYNKGVTDADNRTNTDSANYKAGYNSGYANGNNDTGFKLIVDRVLHSWGGNDSYPGNGEQSYTLTATQTTWWCAGAQPIQKSGNAWCSGQGSGILYAGQSRAFKANTTARGGTGSHAVIHIAAWVKA